MSHCRWLAGFRRMVQQGHRRERHGGAGRGSRPQPAPALKAAARWDHGDRLQLFHLREGDGHNLTARGADGQVGERGLALVCGERAFGERAQGVGVWMIRIQVLPELE